MFSILFNKILIKIGVRLYVYCRSAKIPICASIGKVFQFNILCNTFYYRFNQSYSICISVYSRDFVPWCYYIKLYPQSPHIKRRLVLFDVFYELHTIPLGRFNGVVPNVSRSWSASILLQIPLQLCFSVAEYRLQLNNNNTYLFYRVVWLESTFFLCTMSRINKRFAFVTPWKVA